MSDEEDYEDDEFDEDDEEDEERDTTLRVGGRVQLVGDDDSIKAGLLEAEIPDDQKHTWEKHGQVKWDDGTTTTVMLCDLTVEDNALERAFREAYLKGTAEMEKHLAAADAALEAAVEVAEKYGIPFDSSICFISNTYTAYSLQEKHPKVTSEFIEEVTGVYDEDSFQYGGWRHSQAGC